jgi:hypothetical protein
VKKGKEGGREEVLVQKKVEVRIRTKCALEAEIIVVGKRRKKRPKHLQCYNPP